MEPSWIVILVVVLSAVAYVTITLRRHYRNLDSLLAPQVERHGLTYLGSKAVGPFRWGPFPAVEFKVGVPQAHVMGVRGQYWTYRVVTVRDADGTDHEVWVKLFFAAFRLHEVEWMPQLETLTTKRAGMSADAKVQ